MGVFGASAQRGLPNGQLDLWPTWNHSLIANAASAYHAKFAIMALL